MSDENDKPNYETEERAQAVQIISDHQAMLGDLMASNVQLSRSSKNSAETAQMLFRLLQNPETTFAGKEIEGIADLLRHLAESPVVRQQNNDPMTPEQQEALSQVMPKLAELLPEEAKQELEKQTTSKALKALLEESNQTKEIS